MVKKLEEELFGDGAKLISEEMRDQFESECIQVLTRRSLGRPKEWRKETYAQAAHAVILRHGFDGLGPKTYKRVGMTMGLSGGRAVQIVFRGYRIIRRAKETSQILKKYVVRH